MPETVFIKTYGCQMNVYDSERLGDMFHHLGYRLVDAPQEADVMMMNSCHIRAKAAEKVYSELGKWRLLKEQRARSGGKPITIGVMGCVAQAEGEELQTARTPCRYCFGPTKLPPSARNDSQTPSTEKALTG